MQKWRSVVPNFDTYNLIVICSCSSNRYWLYSDWPVKSFVGIIVLRLKLIQTFYQNWTILIQWTTLLAESTSFFTMMCHPVGWSAAVTSFRKFFTVLVVIATFWSTKEILMFQYLAILIIEAIWFLFLIA